jgi:peptidoglycan/LPS O-acetylase OafA/YrhL
MYKNIAYFKGLNALRFFAAYLVVIHHAEQIRLKYSLFNLKEYSLFNNGGLAVSFFFVLSGFLITYLLLKEQQQTQTISVSKFYVRRILRIWPLYFLLVIVGTLLIPLILTFINHPYKMPYQFEDVILYYIFFTPFMVNIVFGHHLLEPLWSIGVEELFYIIWAPLIKFFKNHILTLIVAIIGIKIVLLISINALYPNSTLYQVISYLKFEAMAIGALGAYIIYHKEDNLADSRLFSTPIQLIMLVLISVRLFVFQTVIENSELANYLFSSFIISDLIMYAVFAWFIINIAVNPKSIINLDNKYMNYLGEISYGIYMYHMLIVFGIVLVFTNFLNRYNNISSSIIFYLMLSLGVILTASISKQLFENQFLKLKNRWQ